MHCTSLSKPDISTAQAAISSFGKYRPEIPENQAVQNHRFTLHTARMLNGLPAPGSMAMFVMH
jgi:hypothetical protein